MEFQYGASYIPPSRYIDTARMLLSDYFNASMPKDENDMLEKTKSALVLASDDPDVYTMEEFANAQRAQSIVRLENIASGGAEHGEEAKTKERTVRRTMSRRAEKAEEAAREAIREFLPEAIGWEGGFYAPLFWSLGRASSPSSTTTSVSDPASQVNAIEPTATTLRLRQQVGRSYLLDLAVLGAGDAVVCTVSSLGCRVLGVMMGWEAFGEDSEGGAWRNVDGTWGWKGLPW